MKIACGLKRKGKKAAKFPRINFPCHPSHIRDIKEIARSLTTITGVHVSAAFLIRLALQEKIPQWKAELKKVQQGRLHAKVRHHYIDMNQ